MRNNSTKYFKLRSLLHCCLTIEGRSKSVGRIQIYLVYHSDQVSVQIRLEPAVVCTQKNTVSASVLVLCVAARTIWI